MDVKIQVQRCKDQVQRGELRKSFILSLTILLLQTHGSANLCDDGHTCISQYNQRHEGIRGLIEGSGHLVTLFTVQETTPGQQVVIGKRGEFWVADCVANG